MWNDEQKQRFQMLRTRELRQELSGEETVELSRMLHDMEEEEASYLRPATQRLVQRNLQIAGQNDALQTLVEREKRLNRYLLRALKKVDSEREAISTELARILESSSLAGKGR